jgi:twitching motility protein PilJ
MSLLDRIKGTAPSKPDAELAGRLSRPFDELSPPTNAMEVTARLGPDGGDTRSAGADSTLSSIISEASPSEAPGALAAARADQAGSDATVGSGLPFIGGWPIDRQQRVLTGMLVMGLVALLGASLLAVTAGGRGSEQVGAVGQAQMQSQRMAKSVSQAVVGNAPAFVELRDSSDALVRDVRSLKSGEGRVAAVPAGLLDQVDALLPLVDKAEKNAAAVLRQQKTLTEAGVALRAMNRLTADLLDSVEALSSLKLQAGAPPAEMAVLGQMAMLTQRMSRNAHEFLTLESVSADAGGLLERDLTTFRDLGQAVLAGNAELRLPGTREPQLRDRVQQLLAQHEQVGGAAATILGNLPALAASRDAQKALVADSEPLRRGLDGLERALTAQGGIGAWQWGAALVAALVLGVGAFGLLRLFVRDQVARSSVADVQRREAEHQESEAKRINDANQAAILRLMNELQTVAEGDLTQQATVTEDITGAIADSVNYTVEELRTLVEQVQTTVARVTDTTGQVEQTSTELLAASTEQLREIRDTGESVLQMAGRINDVSAQAQQTAQVARQSLQAAESGLAAVNNTIGGMNSIRDQIQETSKRIKRLGESSQEIGEITELISDITEQTNVLALNAAIQAASAGEAGRGFSVVAEEVQRLAERSGDATRQIAAIVRTIQADTQDAVAAMERSTQGVVEGARLSDAAGTALGDIDRVSRELSGLIERISAEALSEAESANVVAANIQHIFNVTEQTSDGTRSTAQMVRELSRTAEELRASVARFKVS